MNPVRPNEYSLHLSTGEELLVSELDLSVVQAPDVVVNGSRPLLDLCTQLTREEIEQAKIGHDTALKRRMKSGSVGCLLKNQAPVCGLIKSCIMASKKDCTTRNVSKSGGKFPRCWTFPISGPDGPIRSMTAELCDSIIHAWREGRHVIVVVG